MKKEISKTEALEKIKEFFERDKFRAEEVKKIKRLAMKFRIKLGENRKKFCRKCFAQLKGKIRISKGIKSVECLSCGNINRWKI